MHKPERVILTYRDYELLPDDGKRYEILEGELSVSPAPSPEHQDASGNLYFLFRPHVRGNDLGKVYYAPIDVILSDTTTVQPDLVYLDTSRLTLLSRRGIEGPPTLVVEILSPSTTYVDRIRKRQIYARFGVPHYWILDRERRTIEVYTLIGSDYELTAEVSGRAPVALPPFPDLEIVPAAIWDL